MTNGDGKLGDNARTKVQSCYTLAMQRPKFLAVLKTAAVRSQSGG
jgi:hypothetical protein